MKDFKTEELKYAIFHKVKAKKLEKSKTDKLVPTAMLTSVLPRLKLNFKFKLAC